jgi:CheY-like chemotaxis protein
MAMTFMVAQYVVSVGSRFHILFVDDDANDRELFRLAVRRAALHVSVHTAVDGSEAIAYLEGVGLYADRRCYPVPDLVIVDLKMPLVNGFEFLAWRRASPQFASLPVVVLSGSGRSKDFEQAWSMGATHYLTKPNSLEDLAKILHGTVSRWTGGIPNEMPAPRRPL